MDLACPLCGEKAIMRDYHGTDEQLVCAECGYVVESAGMVSYAFEPSIGHVKQFVSSTSDPSYSYHGPGYRYLMNFLETTAQFIKLSAEVQDLAKLYFQKIYGHQQIKDKTIEYKEILVVACLYLSCRQHNFMYTLLEMSRMTKQNVFELGRSFKIVVSLLNLTLEHAGIGVLSRDLFAKCNLPFSVVKRAHQLLTIGEKFWLISGRNPVGILSAVAYISWKGEKPVERCRIKAYGFCREHGLVCSTMFKNRVNEIEDILCHLALQLPWVKSRPSMEKLPFLLQDILNFQHTLFNKMLKYENKEKEPEKLDENQNETDSKKDTDYGEILPPIMKKPRKRKNYVDLDSNERTQMYSDSDNLEILNVDEYIRSDKEVELLKKLQMSTNSDKKGSD